MEFFSGMIHEYVQTELIPGPSFKDNLISHVLYANDLMLFTTASVRVAGNIQQFLHRFWLFTRLQVNNEKSFIL